jgi:insertion element IS1 protein InsB
LEPFGISKFYTGGRGTYERHIDAERHPVEKENTQQIESKSITLWTRMKQLARRAICFSQTEHTYGLVIGLFMNCYEFSLSLQGKATETPSNVERKEHSCTRFFTLSVSSSLSW